MFGHKDDVAMMRNGCLTLCQFDIPQDLVMNFKIHITILLDVIYLIKVQIEY